MGWWERFTSFADGISDNIWKIQSELESWVKSWAQWAVDKVYYTYDIVQHSWGDVKDYAVTAAAAALELARDEMDAVRDFAASEANKAYNNAVSKINAVSSEINRVKNTLDSKIDSTKSSLLASMANMESVAGAARVALERELTNAINSVKGEALRARNAIVANLENAIRSLETAAKNARNTLEKKLNTAMDVLEREAKQAREVIEGTLIQMIELAEDAFEGALADLERTFDALLKALTARVGGLESWVSKAGGWFDTEINKYRERIITWIVDGFEGILDRVFK